MKVGFVLNGKSEHGIVRATRFLVEALEGLDVSVLKTEDNVPPPEMFDSFQESLVGGVLVVHASHHTSDLWGPYETRIETLSGFLEKSRVPVMLYLHDIYGKGVVANIVEKVIKKFKRDKTKLPATGEARAVPRVKGGLLKKFFSYEERFVRAVDPYVARYIVSNDIEMQRLSRFVVSNKISVLPHFIESRELPCDADTAKQRLGFAGRKVITLLGFIFPRKGHEDAIEALAHLPADVHLVFAGKGSDDYVEVLRNHAREKGVQDRLTITGFLSEDDLNLYMAASDVAVCPFHNVSASGSLATWLSANKPIVAYDQPLMRDYKSKFPEHLFLSPKGDIRKFAGHVGDVLESPVSPSRADTEAYSVKNSARKLADIVSYVGGGQ